MPIIVRNKRVENRFYIDNEFLNGYAKLVRLQGQGVYIALCRHERSGKAFPSIKHLANELGTSDYSVKKGVGLLKKYNIVQVERMGKTLNNIYWLTDYTEWKKIPKSEWSNKTITKSDRRKTPISDRCETTECKLTDNSRDGCVPPRNNTNRIIPINNTNILSAKADEVSKLTNDYINANKRKDIRIILIYAKAKGKIEWSKAEESSFIKRNLRPAKLIEPYSYERIMETMKWLIDNADFPKWTLETVGKYIDEDLKDIKSKIKKEEEIVVPSYALKYQK